ncbi:MAG TPA: response regulator transcription factor [Rhodopseudomonas sp.]|uniref:response regulator transcription factor n=1 Tax=Rhodopseudomonas sp. TaxID=1078 RepID=UPI002ED78CCB
MRFIIADDHPLYLEAVQTQVARSCAGAEVRTTTTVEGAIGLLSQAPADLILLDYSMPGMNGVEGLRSVIAKSDGAPVVVMSGVANRENVIECINAGAKGYIPKTLEGFMFSAAISLVVGGATYVPTEFVMAGAELPQPSSPATNAFYSERELAMLGMVIAGAPNKEIARRFGVQEVTVKYHLSRLYRRMGVNNRAQAVASAVHAGISATLPPDPAGRGR